MTRRTGWPALVALSVLLLAALVGWRLASGGDRTTAADAPLTDQCDDVPGNATRVTLLADDGMRLGGALVGPATADVGLVLRHGASQTICDWLPWAADLSEATGVRVLLFDRRGHGSSPGSSDAAAEAGDTAVAASRLLEDGVVRVALLGSSMGSGPVLDAVASLPVPPCALIGVSPVVAASDELPENVWVTWETGSSGVVSAAGTWTAAPGAHALPVETDHHSLGLVTQHGDVQEFLREAVASCAT